MRKITPILCLIVLVGACNSPKNESRTQNEEVRFEAFKEHFIEALWAKYPGWASSVGFHKYDSVLTIPNEAERDASIQFCRAYTDSLSKFNLSALTINNKTDYYLIKNVLESTLWYAQVFRSDTWDPSVYNLGGAFSEILNSSQLTLEERLKNIALKIQKIPAYYEAASKNINNPTREHTALAIDQITGSISVFDTDILKAIKQSSLSATEKEDMEQKCKTAIGSITAFVDFLKNLKNEYPRPFSIGKEWFSKKFELDIQSQYSASEIYEKALQRKKELHQEMYALSTQLWPLYFKQEKMPGDTLGTIRKMIDKLSLQHVSRDSFQTEIEKQIPELVTFVKNKDLLYIDPSKPLVVRKEPAYMQGVAGASISSPGPYDKNGNTYYNVGSLASYSAAEAESYLREYNNYILQILNIHEAIPGHYTQLVYSNKAPSLIKAILGNGAMIEGWAVYTEKMMLENGYGNNAPEMWLMYYKWHLRSVCNTILDYSLHINNMSYQEAMHLLIDEAFQQEAEAKGKYKRASLTQVQLCSYFTGFTEIYTLREALKNKEGDKFELKKFHEKFLGFGSAPVKYISEAMLK